MKCLWLLLVIPFIGCPDEEENEIVGCDLTGVLMTRPIDGSLFLLGPGIPLEEFEFGAQIVCLNIPAELSGSTRLSFRVDEEPPIRRISVLDNFGRFDLHLDMGPGDGEATSVHEFSVTASKEGFEDFTETSLVTFHATLVDDDLDGDGLLDAPFMMLTRVGDTYSTTPPRAHDPPRGSSVGDFFVRMENFGPSKGRETADTTLRVRRGTPGGQFGPDTEIRVSNTLVNPDELAIIVIKIPKVTEPLHALELLFPDASADVIDSLIDPLGELGELDERIVFPQFFEISILVSGDNGLTFSEIDPARLENSPIELIITRGKSADDHHELTLWAHPSSISETAQIHPEDGDWEEIPLDNQYFRRLNANLTRPSAYVLLEIEVDPAELAN